MEERNVNSNPIFALSTLGKNHWFSDSLIKQIFFFCTYHVPGNDLSLKDKAIEKEKMTLPVTELDTDKDKC